MMDGKTMLTQLRQLIQESDSSSFLNTKTTYDYLYEAACELVSATKMITATQDITTVASTSRYNLNPDFLCLYLRDDSNEQVIKYYDSSSYYWPAFREEGLLYIANNTTDQSIPGEFSISDAPTLPTNLTGTASAAGAATAGECTLTAAAASFSTVSVGDIIHNTTDDSDGYVLAVTDGTHLVTALFGGTDNDWTNADAYVIVPQVRKQLVLDFPSKTAGHTITIKYVCKPAPVYSLHRSYRIAGQYMPAVLKYAAWLYKYRDREPNFGDSWYKYWDLQVRKAAANENRQPDKHRWGVKMKRTAFRDHSMR